MDLHQALTGSPPVFTALVFVLGLLVGSFLNVVVYRLPVMLRREWEAQCAELAGPEAPRGSTPATAAAPFNLVTPRSRCGACGHRIRAIENVPVLSWLFLRGRCSACGARISGRYPVVEAATALLSAAVALRYGPGWDTAGLLVFTWALVAMTGIDLDEKLLPDVITLPLLWLGLLAALLGPAGGGAVAPGLADAVIGAMAGYLSLWSFYHVFRLVTGKEGMGYGDFKLLAALGAWLGWQLLPLVVLLSTVVGALAGVAMMLFAGRDRHAQIPFGPYLAAAGWIAMMWGHDIMAFYFRVSGLAG